MSGATVLPREVARGSHSVTPSRLWQLARPEARDYTVVTLTALESHSSTLRRPYRTVPVAVRTRYGLLCARLLPLCRFTFEVCGQPQLHRLLTPLVIARAPQPLASQGGAEGGR